MSSSLPNRRSIRLNGYDYAREGVYYVTLCTQRRLCRFGDIYGGEVVLSQEGVMVAEAWNWLAEQYPYVHLDAWVLMPNHLHGVILIDHQINGPHKSLGQLIGAFKTVSTKKVNLYNATPAEKLWQRNYYEHIVRSERALDNIRAYIANNPANWSSDSENPATS
jgi:REP element-mobilizing transposase RayT